MLDCNAVGEGLCLVQRDRGAFLLAFYHAGGAGGLDPVDFYIGIEVFDGVGHPGNQSTAADGDHNGVGIFQFIQDLQADGALAGNDFVVIKGMDECGAGIFLELEGSGIGVVIGAFYQADFRSQLFCGFHLADGSTVRHTN